jgi:DNA-binding IclR family transcriptional regulator
MRAEGLPRHGKMAPPVPPAAVAAAPAMPERRLPVPRPSAEAADTAPPMPATGPRSLMRVLGILDHVAKAPDGLTLAQLSARLAAPKSSLLLLLRALVQAGYLRQTHTVYSVGAESYRLASALLGGRTLGRVMRPFMQDLAARTQETVILSVLDRDARSAIYVDVIDSPQALRYSVRVGVARPLYCTSGGRALLAWQDEAWRKAYIAKVKLERLTPQALADRKAFAAEIEQVRAQGYAVCDQQSVPGGAAVGAPVLAADGHAVAALAVACPSARLAADRPRLVADLLEVTRAATGVF